MNLRNLFTTVAAILLPAIIMPASAQNPGKTFKPATFPSVAVSLPASGLAHAAEADIITEAEGTSVTYSRSSTAIAPFDDLPSETLDFGFAGIIVFADNGDVYLKNPFSQIPTNSFLKGKLEDNHISITLPQHVMSLYDEDEDYTYQLYAHMLTLSDDGTQIIKAPDQTLSLSKKDDGSWVMDGGHILGMTYKNGNWTGFGERAMVYSPLTDKPAEIPAGLTFETMALTYSNTGHFVKFAVDGDKCYLKDLLYSKDGGMDAVVGTVTEKGLSFPSGQYIGVNNDNSYLTYFYGGDIERHFDETTGTTATIFNELDALEFTANPDGSYSAAGTALFTPFTDLRNEYLWCMEYYEAPVLRKNDVTSFVPAAPSIVDVQYHPSYGFGWFTMDIPSLNVDGMILDSRNLYYNVFIDGEVFTLYPDEYHMLLEEITDLPYDFTDAHDGLQGDITVIGSIHNIMLFMEGIENVGVQSFYVDENGKEYRSELVSRPLAGIGSAIADSAVAVEETFTDLTGRNVKAPQNGLYIRTVRYSDGTVRSFKELR